MTSPRRDRPRKPARRPAFLLPKQTILIVCEGRKTEPQYFRGLQREYRNSRVDFELSPEQGVPRTLVEIAKRLKKDAQAKANQEGDGSFTYASVWCVFDVDDHPNIADAKPMARDNGIQLAISNPCFELWLLLHFRDNPGMQHREAIVASLIKFVPNYNKHVEYGAYSTGYRDAVARAGQMAEFAERDGESGRNPTTGVYLLTELIRDDR